MTKNLSGLSPPSSFHPPDARGREGVRSRWQISLAHSTDGEAETQSKMACQSSHCSGSVKVLLVCSAQKSRLWVWGVSMTRKPRGSYLRKLSLFSWPLLQEGPWWTRWAEAQSGPMLPSGALSLFHYLTPPQSRLHTQPGAQHRA